MNALLDAGALSVDVSDPDAGTADETPLYGEPSELASGFWPVNCVTALFPADADVHAAIAAASHALERSVPDYRSSGVADQDWVRTTQAQFVPIQICERLWIVPSWCRPIDPQAVNLTLDPGLAFGTGSHPTTRLCLQWLATNLRRGADVLDYGCGSGILAIAAVKLGAGDVVGIDIDPQALVVSRDNATRNGVSARFVLASDSAASDSRDFDVVVANILANPLVLLAPLLAARVRPQGQVVLRACSRLRWNLSSVPMRGGLNRPWRDEEGWVALVGVRRGLTGVRQDACGISPHAHRFPPDSALIRRKRCPKKSTPVAPTARRYFG
jgi:ribosomal protein L11 methyltransferase